MLSSISLKTPTVAVFIWGTAATDAAADDAVAASHLRLDGFRHG